LEGAAGRAARWAGWHRAALARNGAQRSPGAWARGVGRIVVSTTVRTQAMKLPLGIAAGV
jgi:hypothetical protein